MTTATAAGGDDAQATASAFLDALIKGDGERVCALYSSDLLRRVGGLERCEAGFEESDEDLSYDAVETLEEAFIIAQASATRRNGRYFTKQFGKKALAREIERVNPELTVKLGKGPKAASGELVTTVILDTRSTARRLVLYAESDNGSIIRLSAPARGRPELEEVAVGVAEAPGAGLPDPEYSATVTAVTVDSAGTAYARGTLQIKHRDFAATFDLLLVLVPTTAGYRVDGFFYSLLQDP